MEIIYKTADGKTFSSKSAALNHQDTLFDTWLKTPLNFSLTEILDTIEKLEYQQSDLGRTPYDLITKWLRKYFDENIRM